VAHADLFASRQGHTEAGVAMAQLVGAAPATAISEIVLDDGSMARGEALQKFAEAHKIPIFTMKELIDYSEGRLPERISSPTSYSWAKLPRQSAEWSIAVHLAAGGAEHAILKYGNPGSSALVRLHSECLTGDAFGSLRCDCGDQLKAATEEIEKVGAGYIIYLRDHEGRGIGLHQKIAAYILQDSGMDTVDANIALGHEADERDWSDATEILKNLGLQSVTLMTNNPVKAQSLTSVGINVTVAPLQTDVHSANKSYLLTKQERMSHTLEIN
jgi:3,4-dihydroxy 2-butanone 4-phosphate synthase/GTP cyclohydrolase II